MLADLSYHFSCELQPVSFAVDDDTAQALRESEGTPQAFDPVMSRIREEVGIPGADVVIAQPTLAVIKR
jgi:hypothetical protein